MSMRHFFLWMLTILLLVVGFGEFANAGTGAIPKGPDVLILKPNLLFKGGDVKIMTNDTDAPDTVAKDADEGSAYIQDGTGTWYKKTDTGSNTNWQLFIFGALGLTGTDECVPRWDGLGSGVLQDSTLCIDDAGVGTGLTGLYVDGATHADTLHVGAPSRSATAGLVFEVEDSTNTTVVSVSDSGDIIAGKTGSFIDLSTDTHADTLHIGASAVSASTPAILEVESTTLGSIASPIMTEAERDAIVGPVKGLTVFSSGSNTDSLQYYDGNRWRDVGAGGFEEWQASTTYSAGDVVSAIDPVNNRNQLYRADSDLTSDAVNINVANWTEIGEHINAIVSGSATDEAILRWDGTTGDLIQDSTVLIADDGDLTLALGNRIVTSTSTSIGPDFSADTNSDIQKVSIVGGGAVTAGRGALLEVGGNEAAGLSGGITLRTGDNAAGDIVLNGGLGANDAIIIQANDDIFFDNLTPTLPLQLDSTKQVISQALDLSNASSSFTGILPTINGGTGLDGSGATNGQLLIGNGAGGFDLNVVSGTANQVIVTNSSGGITFSTPQDIHTGASPTFVSASFSGITVDEPLRLDGSGNLTTGPTDLASEVAGILPVTSGGTSSSAALVNDRVMISSGDAIVESTELLLDTTSAAFHVSATDSGVLLPRLTTAQKTGIATPEDSLLLFDTDLNKFNFWNGSAWKNISGTTLSSETVAIEDYDEVRIPLSQLTVVSSSATNRIARLETGSDNFLENPSFEAETYTSGWTTSGSATYTLNPDGWEGQGVSISATGGTQSFELFQSFTDTEFEGNTFGFTCMVKSNSAKVKLCTENGTDEKDCVYHDGNGMYKKMQAIMMVDSTGVLVGSVKNDTNENAEVVVDDCKWTNDPLKIKNAHIVNSVMLEGNDGRGINANTEPVFFSGSGTGWVSGGDGTTLGNGNYYEVQNDNAVIHIKGHVAYTTTATSFFNLYVGVLPYKRINENLSSLPNHAIDYQSAKGEFKKGDKLSIVNISNSRTLSNDNVIHWLNIVETLENEEILTASDIVSSETMAFTFKGSGAGALDCNTDPVGTYTTYSKTASSNVTSQCANDAVDPPTNLDGFKLTTVGYGSARACDAVAGESRVDICIGKGLREVSLKGYSGLARSGDALALGREGTATNGYGVDYIYNESSGLFSINVGMNRSGVNTRELRQVSGTVVNDGYFHFHASKNPVVNAHETIPIVDYSWENEFSALIDGTSASCPTLTANQDFIDSCTRTTTGTYQITWKAGFFSVAPKVTATSEAAFRNISVNNSATTTGVTMSIYRHDTTQLDNRRFHIHVSRQGSDYKERGSTAAIIAQPTCFIKDVKPANTVGGTFTSGDPDGAGPNFGYTRDLTTLEGDCTGISIVSNQIILPKGTWKIYGFCPAYDVADHKCVLYNDDTSSIEVVGSSTYANASANVESSSVISGVFNSSENETFEIQHRCSSTSAGTTGLGNPSNFGVDEVYTTIELTRIR